VRVRISEWATGPATAFRLAKMGAMPDESILTPPERDPVIEAYKAGVDRTLFREMLKLSPDERLRRIEELGRFQEELRKAGRALR